MPEIITDEVVKRWIAEPKRPPSRFREALTPHRAGAHLKADVQVLGQDGRIYVVNLRKSALFANNFSVLLSVMLRDRSQPMCLTRYNGDWQPHRNPIEGEYFQAPHIHFATERYQRQEGIRDEHYAIPTDRFDDFAGAFQCLIEDCRIENPDEQEELFPWSPRW